MSERLITSFELSAITALGFKIHLNGSLSAENLINAYFKGFDLLRFVEETEKNLKQLAEDSLVKIINLDSEVPPKLSVKYYTINLSDPDHRLLFSRTFTNYQEDLIVDHDFLSLPLEARGRRIGRKVLKFCLQHYLDIGVTKIRVHAALEDGGYEWTKAGFRATQPQEMEKILKYAANELNTAQFNIAKRLYDDYYETNPEGKAFPIIEWAGLPFMKNILRQNDWHGEIDLKNTVDLFNFNEYVNG